MEAKQADMFLMQNSKFFESHQVNIIRDRLLTLEKEKWPLVFMADYKDPATVLILSIVAGPLGIDRFMIGDTGFGMAKLLTGGGCGIWTIIDWFLIQKATRERNMELLMAAIR